MSAKRIIQDIDPTSALEVSFVRRGANPMAKVFLKKSADQPQPPETTNMALKSVVLAGLMTSTVGAALAKSFKTDAELDTFVAKTDAEQAAELAAFAKANKMPFSDDDADDKKAAAKKAADEAVEKAAADKAAADAALAKAGDIAALVKSAVEAATAPLQKQLEEAKAGIEKSVSETRDAQIAKRAETEFRHLGIGIEKTAAVLKALDGLDKTVREDIETVFKAHAALASRVAKTVGLTDIAKDANSATAQLNKAAEDLAKAENVSFHVAFAKVNNDPQYAALVEKADEEEAALAA